MRQRGGEWRLVRRLGLCTLAGAVVTWAVAWGYTIWGAMTYQRSFSTWEGVDWDGARASWPDVPQQWGTPYRHDGGTNAVMTGGLWRFRQGEVAMEFKVGWPARAMRWSHSGRTPPARVLTAPDWLRPREQERVLPCEVLPLGFAISTAFYSLLLLGMVEGVGFARRRSRTRRGLCCACGYDRRGLSLTDLCPECGSGATRVDVRG